MTQESNPELKRIKENLGKGKSPRFEVYEDGTLWFHNHLCIPKNEELRKNILEEAHNTRDLMHPRGTQMYIDLRQYIWWNNMKKEITKYMDKYMNRHKVKAEDQRLMGEPRPFEIPILK